jgi:hypothetical protein
VFIIITLLTVIALILGLSFHRFKVTRNEGSFFGFLRQKTARFFKGIFPRRWRELVKIPLLRRFPAAEKWLWISFITSFAYLVMSGFGYAFFSRRGLHGYPLLLHVFAGGLYAVSLALIVMLRANKFIIEVEPLSFDRDPSRLRNPFFSAVTIQKILFWLFVFCGLVLIISALSSMLTLLYFSGQKSIFEVHRYSALVSLLIAIVFSYFLLVDQNRR